MSLPLSMALLSDLIGLIYDAAIDPARWPAAIEDIRVALGFGNAAFGLQALPSGEVLLNVTSNIPPDYAERMVDYGPDIIDLWGDPAVLMTFPMDQPAVLSRINPGAVRFETSTNRYALEWARPQGIIDAMSLALARDERGFGALSFGRHESAGPIGEPEIEAARLLIPHLQRAATINRLLDLAALARSTFAAAIDSFSVPVILTTGTLHVVHANPAAAAIVAKGDILLVRGGLLGARSAMVANALSLAVAQAARDESAIGRKGLGIPVLRDGGSASAIHVLPLRPGRFSSQAEARAAVFVARSDTPFVAPTELAAALFGLTPAEARVFERIASGFTVAEASHTLAVERSTVRTHLLRLFEKTGTKRQAELVQLAASLVVPVGLMA